MGVPRTTGLVTVLWLAAGTAWGQDDALQTRINKAIDRGAEYLKAAQTGAGHWGDQDEHKPGLAALAGWTLLESGVPAKDESIQKAAQFVRRQGLSVQKTYSLSLTILFLDRLGEPRDRPIIQAAAARLLGGLATTGTWSYTCPLFPDRAWLADRLRKAADAGKTDDKQTDSEL